jgi:hypothetical protein
MNIMIFKRIENFKKANYDPNVFITKCLNSFECIKYNINYNHLNKICCFS